MLVDCLPVSRQVFERDPEEGDILGVQRERLPGVARELEHGRGDARTGRLVHVGDVDVVARAFVVSEAAPAISHSKLKAWIWFRGGGGGTVVALLGSAAGWRRGWWGHKSRSWRVGSEDDSVRARSVRYR